MTDTFTAVPSPSALAFAKTEEMKDYLRGYGRPDGLRLVALASFTDWPEAARTVLAARCTRVLDHFDDETLAMIANLEISVPAVSTDVANELALQLQHAPKGVL